VGQEDRARKPIGVIVREIDQGDPSQKAQTISLLRYDLTGEELVLVFPHLLRALKDDSEMVRNAAATVLGDLSRHISGEAPIAEEALSALLDDRSPALRATAAKSLGSIAASGRLEAPPPRLVACLDDENEQVRSRAAEALVAYRKGPELIVPVALRRLPTESPAARNTFRDLFWHVRLEPSVLPFLIAGLLSENTEVRLSCTAAINHMGPEARPALAAILSLLRKEIDTPRPNDSRDEQDRIIGMAAGAIGEITSDGECPPGSVEILCEILRRPGGEKREADRARSDSPGPSTQAPGPQEECLAEAIWSLGILGRPAVPAVPLLLSTFESARGSSNLRGLTAEALAEITRGTPDEDRVLATLAKAWKTAPEGQKTAIARAIRRLGPKSEQRVEGLGEWPVDAKGSQIRRVRYPR
jgi:HEAT repeat protein